MKATRVSTASGLILMLSLTALVQAQSLLETEEVQVKSDFDKVFTEVVRDAGYFSESHFVTTADGYILNLYRIMKTSSGPKGAEVVYLQHGILDTADTWISHYPEIAPAF